MPFAVVIVAAGRGTRLGSEVPKQYIPLNGVCALRRSIDAFLALSEVSHLSTVIHPGDAKRYEVAVTDLDDPRVLAPVNGGANRAESVRHGLEALAPFSPDRVLIHDGARPFIDQETIQAVLDGLETSDGSFAALPVVDALWREADGFADVSEPRDGLWRAQTPQGFRFDKIRTAHLEHDGQGADDVAVAREAGLAVKLVLGSEQNYKITTADDLTRAIADAERLDRQSD